MTGADPDWYEEALQVPYAREMDFTGKPLKGFILVGVEGFTSDEDLDAWVTRCEQFVRSLPPK